MQTTLKYKTVQVIKTQTDIEAWGLTFGQRIGLGNIYSEPGTDFEKFEKVFICLEGREPEKEERTNWVEYLSNVAIGFSYWMLQETLLKYEPTPEQIKELEKVDITIYDSSDPAGNTVRALARNYNVEPADVLNWKYSEVFKILLDDFVKSKM